MFSDSLKSSILSQEGFKRKLQTFLFLMLSLLLVSACQVKQQEVNSGFNVGNLPESEPRINNPEVENEPDTRIFDQAFELDASRLFVSFQSCEYNKKCTAQIEHMEEPDDLICLYNNAAPYQYIPSGDGDYSCKADYTDMSCLVEVVVKEDGSMKISSAESIIGNCGSFVGDYGYQVVECQGLDQMIWKCGMNQQRYDLIWVKLI